VGGGQFGEDSKKTLNIHPAEVVVTREEEGKKRKGMAIQQEIEGEGGKMARLKEENENNQS